MNIHTMPGDVGDILCNVQRKLVLAVCRLEEILPELWSDHMDELHGKLRRLITDFDFIQTMSEQVAEEDFGEEDPCICIPDEPNTNCPSCF